MKANPKALAASLISVMLFATSFTPAAAVPFPNAKAPQASEAEQVQYRRDHRYRPGYYRGHRGHREYRRGYRRHSDGWWYPLAAFGAGAVIGGAIANQPRTVGGINPQHIEWCSNRYRTYRASDNTYVPRVGVRARCTSPYY